MINKCVLIKPKKDHSGTFGRLSVLVALQEPVIVKQVCKLKMACFEQSSDRNIGSFICTVAVKVKAF